MAPDLDLYGMGVLSELGNKLGVSLDCGEKNFYLRFFCEIELISLKFLQDSCKIPAFQIGPEMLVPN